VPRLAQLDAAQPERPHLRAQAQCFLRIRIEQALQSYAEVALLELEAGQGLVEPVDELHQPRGVPSGDGIALARGGEPACGVAADRLEQPVAPLAVAVLPYEERLLDKSCEQERDFVVIEAVSGADLLGRLQREASREGREPPQQDLLLGREQLVAPVERRLERLLARRRRCGCSLGGGGSGRRGGRPARPE
jgi:hypothetical protein